MLPKPDWVKALQPAGVQGPEILRQERAKSNVRVDQLAQFLVPAQVLARNQRLLEILQADPIFDKSQNYFGSRMDRVKTALSRGKRLRQLSVQHRWTKEEEDAANDLVGEATPYTLHASMFFVTLREQGTTEQHKLFLDKAENYEYIGCYAQTELGHGSNVRGLETTATWNRKSKTFFLHSPSMTASKWWVGNLGKAANFAIVMAQLIIDGKSFGPHAFVTQIRDLKTHEPLDGIYVGDIGPKFGYNTMDNGFILFHNVEIPHVSMLARFARVDPVTSKYSQPANPSQLYGTMTYIRSKIVFEAGLVLARGVTIATRYCAIRRQFRDEDSAGGLDSGETQVLDYKMVQFRLLPLLATTYAFHFTGGEMLKLYRRNQDRLAPSVGEAATTSRGAQPVGETSDSALMADLHSTSCALKALVSTVSVEGLEVCRRACGGHGYSSFSGIGSWYADYLPNTTWEGDNYMLTQQVSRYLLKSARAVLKGSNIPENEATRLLMDWRRQKSTGTATDYDIVRDDQHLVAAFGWRVASLTFEALRHRDEEKWPWNSLLVHFWRLSTAYAQFLVVKNFYTVLADHRTADSLDPETHQVLRKLFRLYSLATLCREAHSFVASGAATTDQVQLAETHSIMCLLEELRPHAVRLVDAWKLPDWQLDSSLGRYDGKAYEDMFYRASELNPLNSVVFDPYPNSEVLFRDLRGRRDMSKL